MSKLLLAVKTTRHRAGNAALAIVLFVVLLAGIGGTGVYIYSQAQKAKEQKKEGDDAKKLEEKISELERKLAEKEKEATKAAELVPPSQPKVEKPSVPPPPACKRFNIREGEFASDKCYTSQDYDDLIYYIDRYNDSIFDYNAAGSAMNVHCNSDYFAQYCEQDKKKRDEAQQNIDKYKETIKGIIAKGT